LRLANFVAQIEHHELRAVVLAFLCNFRAVRQLLHSASGARCYGDGLRCRPTANPFTGTLVFTLVCAPIYSALVSRLKLTRLLPGIFWFWVINILIFYALFETAAQNRWVIAAYYWWFSVVNLFMISVFLELDGRFVFGATGHTLIGVIAAGGSIGAIAAQSSLPCVSALSAPMGCYWSRSASYWSLCWCIC